ncbi:MAG TPA: carboxypeptidase-like regulatory domain-containing protein [Vicinamibacterales bacterium]|jgi:hypothetical protein|nr:carboxypeptidase-like regulatory domain-containing protein [Vicinamibacterales bacterium]
MKPCWLLVILALVASERTAFASTDAQETIQNPPNPADGTSCEAALSVRESNQLLVPVTLVTAAYSLDPLIAEAQVDGDEMRVGARSPGESIIVLVRGDHSTSCMRVTVTRAPPIQPDGVWNGLESGGRGSRGYYEGRFASDPLQFGDIVDYRSGRTELHVNNTVVPGRNVPGASVMWFPYSYVRYGAGDARLTFLDQAVESSPLSLRSTLVRGMHVDAGGLSVHAGFTSVAGFQTLLLPVDSQSIFGATYTHRFGGETQVGVTGYFIQRDPVALSQKSSQGVESMFFKKKNRRLDLFVEAGLSDGRPGGAFMASHDADTDQFHIAARYRPLRYAASETDNLKGLQSEMRWAHAWRRRVFSSLSGSNNRTFIGAGAQTVEAATADVHYKAAGGISLSSGISGSRIADTNALFPEIKRVDVPLGVSYDRTRFGVSAQYGYSKTSHAVAVGHRYQGALRVSGQRLQLSANAGLDTQALGIDSVFSAFPALNVELAQLGLGATSSVPQLVALLTNRAFLSSLGIAPGANLQLVPRNWRGGLNAGWRGRAQLLEFDWNYNLNAFLNERNTTTLQSIRYRRSLTGSGELVTAFSLLEQVSPMRRLNPVVEVGLRHQFGGSTSERRQRVNGTISGAVRAQDQSGTHPLRAAAITLDGDRRTTSDDQGRYRFGNVGPGSHVVQIRFESTRSFWYTTPSKVSAAADAVVDFGVMYPSAQIIGYAVDDAGLALPDIGILITGPRGKRTLVTDRTGACVVPVEAGGTYEVSVNAETVPDGYALEDLRPATVSLIDGDSKKISFTLSAIRALVGSVQTYDAARETYVPVAGATVELRELNRTSTTNRAGGYVFRDMPSGTFTVLVNGQRYDEVELSVAPQVLRHEIRLPPFTSAQPGQKP